MGSRKSEAFSRIATAVLDGLQDLVADNFREFVKSKRAVSFAPYSVRNSEGLTTILNTPCYCRNDYVGERLSKKKKNENIKK